MHLCGKRYTHRSKGKYNFKAYSNIGQPELFIDGKSAGPMQQGLNNKLYHIKDIQLDPGHYTIEIRTGYDQKLVKDQFKIIVEDE
jgi:hypothetical protein